MRRLDFSQTTPETQAQAKSLQTQLRAHRKEMRENGIRRTSFMNGGLDRITYAANCEVFRLETELLALAGKTN